MPLLSVQDAYSILKLRLERSRHEFKHHAKSCAQYKKNQLLQDFYVMYTEQRLRAKIKIKQTVKAIRFLQNFNGSTNHKEKLITLLA